MLVLAILFVLGWIALKVVVGVTSFAIHALLAVAVVAAIAHFVKGRGTAAPAA